MAGAHRAVAARRLPVLPQRARVRHELARGQAPRHRGVCGTARRTASSRRTWSSPAAQGRHGGAASRVPTIGGAGPSGRSSGTAYAPFAAIGAPASPIASPPSRRTSRATFTRRRTATSRPATSSQLPAARSGGAATKILATSGRERCFAACGTDAGSVSSASTGVSPRQTRSPTASPSWPPSGTAARTASSRPRPPLSASMAECGGCAPLGAITRGRHPCTSASSRRAAPSVPVVSSVSPTRSSSCYRRSRANGITPETGPSHPPTFSRRRMTSHGGVARSDMIGARRFGIEQSAEGRAPFVLIQLSGYGVKRARSSQSRPLINCLVFAAEATSSGDRTARTLDIS